MEFGLVIGYHGRFVADRRKGSLTFEKLRWATLEASIWFPGLEMRGTLGIGMVGDLHVIAIDNVVAYGHRCSGKCGWLVEVIYVEALA